MCCNFSQPASGERSVILLLDKIQALAVLEIRERFEIRDFIAGKFELRQVKAFLQPREIFNARLVGVQDEHVFEVLFFEFVLLAFLERLLDRRFQVLIRKQLRRLDAGGRKARTRKSKIKIVNR